MNITGRWSSIKTAFVRLPRNLKSNRYWVWVDGWLYHYSPQRSREWAHGLNEFRSAGMANLPRVYTRLRLTFSKGKQTPSESTAFLIPHLGRFGNAVREVVSAIAVARKLAVGHVFLAGDNIFCRSSDVPSPGIHLIAGGPRVWIDEESGAQKSIDVLVLWTRRHYRVEEYSGEKAWDDARKVLSLDVKGSLMKNHLVIHVRGGDVFGSRDARAYGQPPLAFYTSILDLREWEKVTIVHQDTKNPVLSPLIDECKSRSLSLVLQSFTLRDDIMTLMAAHTIVAGRGTFVPAVVGLSPFTQRVFYFEDKFVIYPPKKIREVIKVEDKVGSYREQALSDNWENSEQQRSLMISYSQDNLEHRPSS